MDQLLKKHAEKARFALVGSANTSIDFGILFILTFFFGIDKIVANYFSTGIALMFSFFANKSFTFQHQEGDAKKQFLLFLIITLVGLWVLQPFVILVCGKLLIPYLKNQAINLLATKLIATIISLIWNYLLYSRFVFKKNNSSSS